MYKNNNKKLISYLMALIMVLAFAGCKTDNKPDDMKIQRTVYIEVVNESSNYNKQYELKTEKETLGEALEELGNVKFESGAYGKYITSIDDFYADTKKEQWWGFTVNGEFSETGVDDTKLNDGDKIVFTYNIGYN